MTPKTTHDWPTHTVELAHHDAEGLGPLHTEWLLTNGTGAFAMGTVIGCNTRRYHGLLIAATHPPVGRINALNNIGETLRFEGRAYELDSHEFASNGSTVFHPEGWRHQQRFEKSPNHVTWCHQCGPVHVTKTLRLIWKKQIAVVRYELAYANAMDQPVPDRVTLSLRPHLAMRDFHAMQQAFSQPFTITGDRQEVRIESPANPPLFLATDAGRFVHQPDWWHDFHYRIDAARHQDCRESLYTPGTFEHTFATDAPGTITIAFGIEPIDWQVIHALDPRIDHLNTLRAHVARETAQPGDSLTTLVAASDDFVVDRTVDGKPSTTIMAGYPWFSDWGRDTMIALPGCLLVTGRFAEAKRTLLTFAAHIKDGLIPNRFDDYGGDPHYNTVDASLWFIHAALEYVRETDDHDTWRSHLADACQQIIAGYQRGTFDIRMDTDGLITAGSPDTQLTWMDAARDGVVFTPRYGKAVEINALWYNALCGCAALADSKSRKDLTQLAKRVKQSFSTVFWDETLGYLLDHVNADYRDGTCRPNQLLAVSLPHSPLASVKQKKVMVAVRDRLLTPMGLRSLPADDSRYHSHYQGTMFERDQAYHQGTVWAWLIGPFIAGWLRAHNFTPKARQQAQAFLNPLLDQLDRGLGQLHEIFDGDAPHTPRGCPAQAWSIAETLRAQCLIHTPHPEQRK